MSERKPRGYWKKKENIVSETYKAMHEQGWETFPGADKLKKAGYSSLLRAIEQHIPGSYREFREYLGFSNAYRPRGYWTKENVVKEAKQALREQDWDILPSQTILDRHGYTALCNAINIYFPGKIQGLREYLGQPNVKKPAGTWQDLDFIIAQAQEAIEKQGWKTLPGSDGLRKAGYRSLVHAIEQNFPDSFRGLREHLGLKNTHKPRDYWQQPAIIIAEAENAMKEQNWKTLPGSDGLAKKGYSSLARAIGAYFPGKMHGLRLRLGLPSRKPNKYWLDTNNFFEEARHILHTHQFDVLPSESFLKRHGYGALLNAARKYYPGGLCALREDLCQQQGLPSQREQLEELLEDYVAE